LIAHDCLARVLIEHDGYVGDAISREKSGDELRYVRCFHQRERGDQLIIDENGIGYSVRLILSPNGLCSHQTHRQRRTQQ